jgi:hypothetical protein
MVFGVHLGPGDAVHALAGHDEKRRREYDQGSASTHRDAMSLENASRLVKKMVPVEREVSRTKGHVSLFALFRRRDFPVDWDVVIAAPWVDAEKKMDQLKYVDSVLKKHVGLLSRSATPSSSGC